MTTRLLSCLALVLTALSAERACADEPGAVFEDLYVEGAVQFGSAGPFGLGNAFVPLWSNDLNLMFLEFRGVTGDDDEAIRSYGLGFRHQTDSLWIVGGYAFFDRHRQTSRVEDRQVMFGIELLSVDWDFRLNAYLPNDGVSRLSNRGVLAGGTVLIETIDEAAYFGNDVEVGALLTEWQDGRLELRAYAGAFWFDQRRDGFDALTGPRARVELRLYDLPWLGNGSRLVASGQYEWDQIRGSQSNLLVNLRVPLRFQKSRKLDRFERRMFNPIARYPGVVAVSTRHHEPAVFADGREIQSVAVFDANTPDAATQISALGGNSMAILDGRAGPIRSETIQMQPGQALVGGGVHLSVYGRDTGRRATFVIPGTRPTLDYRGLNRNIIELPRSHGAVIGLDMLGGDNGIVGGHAPRDAPPVALSDNAHTASGEATPPLTLIARNRIALADGSTGPFQPRGNGVVLDYQTSSILYGEAGLIGPVAVVQNRLDGNRFGVLVLGEFEGAIVDNRLSENTESGIAIWAEEVHGSIEKNQIETSGRFGIDLSGNLFGDLRENTAVGHQNEGIRVLGNVTGDIVANESSGNGGSGFKIFGSVDGDVRDNRAEGNEEYGFRLIERVTGNIENNTAMHNGAAGIFTDDVTGAITGNTLGHNGTSANTTARAGLMVHWSAFENLIHVV